MRRLLCGGALLAAFGASPAGAGSLVVNTLADPIPFIPGDGACTLREAIAIANANDGNTSGDDCAAASGADTITFSVGGTITLGATLFAIDPPA